MKQINIFHRHYKENSKNTVPKNFRKRLLWLIESTYFQCMRSTVDIQFFVRRSRIIPEPPFPFQGIAGSGNVIGVKHTSRTSVFRKNFCLHILIRETSCVRLSIQMSSYNMTCMQPRLNLKIQLLFTPNGCAF